MTTQLKTRLTLVATNLDTGLRRPDLRLSDVGGAVNDLPLQVAEIDDVEVDDAERAHAGRGEIERRRRSETTSADAKHTRRLETPLSVLPDFRQQQVAAVALALADREF